MNALSPNRADFRIIQRILNIYFPNQVAFIPKEIIKVSNAFNKLSGSWEKLFNGDISQIRKLKAIVKVAVKKGFISRTSPDPEQKKDSEPKKKPKVKNKHAPHHKKD